MLSGQSYTYSRQIFILDDIPVIPIFQYVSFSDSNIANTETRADMGHSHVIVVVNAATVPSAIRDCQQRYTCRYP